MEYRVRLRGAGTLSNDVSSEVTVGVTCAGGLTRACGGGGPLGGEGCSTGDAGRGSASDVFGCEVGNDVISTRS